MATSCYLPRHRGYSIDKKYGDGKMNIKQMKTFLKESLIKNPQRAVYISGAVGIGKSEAIKQTADELNFKFIDIRLGQRDPTDIKGLFYIVDGTIKCTIPPEFPTADSTENTVIFLDEFSNAPQSVQNASLQLLLDRRLGNYIVPKNTRIVCAGNRLIDGAFVFRLSSAVQNRLIQVTLNPDFEEWKTHAYLKNINPLIIGYHNFTDGKNLHTFKNDVDVNAFATPRSWFFTDEVIKLNLEPEIELEAIQGCIGESLGIEFFGYKKIHKDLPDTQKILDGENIKVTEPNICYALCSGLIGAVRHRQDKMGRMIEYISECMPKEFQVVLLKDILKTDLFNQVVINSAYQNWISKNKDVIL